VGKGGRISRERYPKARARNNRDQKELLQEKGFTLSAQGNVSVQGRKGEDKAAIGEGVETNRNCKHRPASGRGGKSSPGGKDRETNNNEGKRKKKRKI